MYMLAKDLLRQARSQKLTTLHPFSENYLRVGGIVLKQVYEAEKKKTEYPGRSEAKGISKDHGG